MEKALLKQWFQETYDTDDRVDVLDEASVSVIRERVRELGREIRLDLPSIEIMVITASEFARNQLLHARRGAVAARIITRFGVQGLELIAADLGEGIDNPKAALQGKISTSGGLGEGLAAVYRLCDEVDFDIRLGQGTCIWARKFAKASGVICCELAIFGRPYPGEAVSGDNGIFLRQKGGVLAAVVDGLGHGLLAWEAAKLAVSGVAEKTNRTLESILLKSNSDLAESRGAAMNLVRFRGDQHLMEHVGVGDVSTQYYRLRESKRFIAVPHVLGRPWTDPTPQTETWTIAPGGVLIMFTDGLKSEATLSGQLELLRRPAIAIAQYLVESYGRENDDALVFVAKFKGV